MMMTKGAAAEEITVGIDALAAAARYLEDRSPENDAAALQAVRGTQRRLARIVEQLMNRKPPPWLLDDGPADIDAWRAAAGAVTLPDLR